VLVVEDDADQAELVQRVLERQNFRVTVVGDSAACLEKVAAHRYSVILLDYSLPRMNGLEVLTELRARGVGAPVVMVTAQGDERLAVESMQAGGMDFVVKTSGYLTGLPSVLRKVLTQHELALENERLHRETRQRLRDAEALVDLSRSISANLDFDALLGVIGRAAARACEMERCSIFECRDGRVRLLASQRADGALDQGIAPACRGEAGGPVEDLPFLAPVFDDGAAVVIEDASADARVFSSLGFGANALLVLPLVRQAAVVGALIFDSVPDDGVVAPARLVLATAVAGQVSLALDNARLYAETQRALADLGAAQEQLIHGKALRALGELASGAAHHLNNLLAVIVGRCQLLLQSGQVPAARRPLEIIERSARDGAEVVRRIQQFSRTRQEDEAERVDLNQVVCDVVEMTRARWHDGAIAQGIAVKTTCELGAIPPVLGHSASLREVVTNLVLNAVDALPRGGNIRVRTWAEGEHVMLGVSDDGIGMSDDVRRRALEPFFTTKGVRSTGLGLSVNFGIIERHHGALSIASAPGQGTAITVRLPAVSGHASPAAPAPVRELPAERRVLVVDDQLEVRQAIGELLESRGLSVTLASGGQDALAQLDAGLDPDVVITDLGMPGMTGRELAHAIKQRWRDLPVGLVTGWGDSSRHTQDSETDFVMSKPIDLDRLLEAIDRAIGDRHAAAPR
jgi:signal transduction histidine kinase/FixJ family two-component response regulator